MTTTLSWDAYPVPEALPPAIINDPALPLVSIVTPSYNQGQFIRETIESILTQNYPNIEYWVIDGGSTDNTLAVLKAYEHDPRFHWLSEPDQGQSDAINKGWSRCRGEIVAWLNSDDTYYPQAIQLQVSYLLQNPEIDIVYGDCTLTDQHGTPMRTYYGRPFRFLDLLRFIMPYQPTLFLSKKAVLKGGPLDKSFHYSMDSEYWLRLYQLGFRFVYNPHLIATYRFHDTSKTITAKPKMLEDWRRLIDLYAPPELYSRAKADLHLAAAIEFVKAGDIRQSLHQVKLALSIKWTPRVVLYLIALLNKLTGVSFYENILGIWMKFKKRV